jgi:hypothetical protein
MIRVPERRKKSIEPEGNPADKQDYIFEHQNFVQHWGIITGAWEKQILVSAYFSNSCDGEICEGGSLS